jgi:class 3 adenylate cyclase
MDAMRREHRSWFTVAAGEGRGPMAGPLQMAGTPQTTAVLLTLGCTLAVVSIFTDGLIAPPIVTLAGTTLFLLATLICLAAASHREAWLRSRFEQHLAPAVVRRILETPGIAKLSGERREVTALFTDVEGFTATMHRADPAILVNALDNYFEGMATIIIDHGGIIDKIVGDAVHALFNAPNDLEDHPRKAVDCAIAMRSWSEAFCHRPEVANIGFGRTRIGLETGPAIVGDVGIRTRLDYTAHGDAVNVAARLEAANKQLGSSICVGPIAASRCSDVLLRPLGWIVVRGRDDAIMVFEPVVLGRLASPAEAGFQAIGQCGENLHHETGWFRHAAARRNLHLWALNNRAAVNERRPFHSRLSSGPRIDTSPARACPASACTRQRLPVSRRSRRIPAALSGGAGEPLSRP